MADLQKQIDDLRAIVDKQGKLLATTGQQMLALQVNDVKTRMKSIDDVSASIRGAAHAAGAPSSELDLSDYVTNEDLIQMVGELQGQLDGIEDRAIRRLANSHSDTILPLSNREGDEPTEESLGFPFPATVAEFAALPKIDVIQLAIFYEIIVPDARKADVAAFAQGGDGTDVAATKRVLEGSAQSSLAQVHDSISDAELEDVKAEVARYLGVVKK
ncbi:hypothetical protein DICA3_E07558 [Diutina catenulata]